MSDWINDLSPAALSAAIRGGTSAWGRMGSVSNVRYAQASPGTFRRRCRCGCKRRATHLGMANGVCLMSGCEFEVAYWVKHGYPPRALALRKSLSESTALSPAKAAPKEATPPSVSPTPSQSGNGVKEGA